MTRWSRRRRPSFIHSPVEADPASDAEVTAASERHKAAVEAASRRFLRTVGRAKRHVFEQAVRPYWQADQRVDDAVDIETVERWILRRVLELGWSPEAFSEFEQDIQYARSRRDLSGAQRVGKKYQWIALHEVLARAADNLEFAGQDQVMKQSGIVSSG